MQRNRAFILQWWRSPGLSSRARQHKPAPVLAKITRIVPAHGGPDSNVRHEYHRALRIDQKRLYLYFRISHQNNLTSSFCFVSLALSSLGSSLRRMTSADRFSISPKPPSWEPELLTTFLCPGKRESQATPLQDSRTYGYVFVANPGGRTDLRPAVLTIRRWASALSRNC
jgi:hypothetical protein